MYTVLLRRGKEEGRMDGGWTKKVRIYIYLYIIRVSYTGASGPVFGAKKVYFSGPSKKYSFSNTVEICERNKEGRESRDPPMLYLQTTVSIG